MYTLLKKKRAFLKGKGFPAEKSPAIQPGVGTEKPAEASTGGASHENLFRSHNRPGGPTAGGPGLDSGNEDDALASPPPQIHALRGKGADFASSPAISPGDETDDFAGDENPFSGTSPGKNRRDPIAHVAAGSEAQQGIGVGESGMKTSSFGGGSRQGLAHALANHHQKLADHFRSHASAAPSDGEDINDSFPAAHQPGAGTAPRGHDAGEETPEHEALESPEVEMLEHEHGEGHPGASVEGEGRDTKTIGGAGKNLGKADEIRQEEADDVGEAGAKRKGGGSLRNSKGSYGKPLSRFAKMAHGR